MSRRVFVLAAMLAVCLLLGTLIGNWYFHLFRQTVPPAVLTSFNQATARAAFLGYGLATGAVIFLWSLAVLALARLFRRS
jgi:hypothetical protein